MTADRPDGRLDGRPDGRTVRGQRTREAILDAAIDLVRIEGASSLTHRAVAAKAGTSLAATTYHFDTLDDLLVAAFERLSERTVTRLASYSTAVLDGRRDLIEAAMEFAESDNPLEGFGSIGMTELVHAATRHDRLHEPVRRYVEQLAGVFAPYIGTANASTLVHSLTGVILHHVASDPDATSRAALRADVTRLFDAFGLTEAGANQLIQEAI
jgi:DNA-binding transcriptional regulator YbjK